MFAYSKSRSNSCYQFLIDNLQTDQISCPAITLFCALYSILCTYHSCYNCMKLSLISLRLYKLVVCVVPHCSEQILLVSIVYKRSLTSSHRHSVRIVKPSFGMWHESKNGRQVNINEKHNKESRCLLFSSREQANTRAVMYYKRMPYNTVDMEKQSLCCLGLNICMCIHSGQWKKLLLKPRNYRL